LDTTTLASPSVLVAGATALIWVWLTKLIGAGLPSMATVTPPSVVGYTLLTMELSHVAAADAKFVPVIVIHEPASTPAAPVAAFTILEIAGRLVVALEAGVSTYSAV